MSNLGDQIRKVTPATDVQLEMLAREVEDLEALVRGLRAWTSAEHRMPVGWSQEKRNGFIAAQGELGYLLKTPKPQGSP